MASDTTDICGHCGKHIGAGRHGSLTQYIFRRDLCNCEIPLPTRTDSVVPPKTSLSGRYVDDGSEPELPLTQEVFPIERYKPLSVLGRGATGVVYLCRDRLLGKKVAIKTLRELTAEQLVSFQLEAKATSRLKHHAVVTVMDFGATESGRPFMVMEHVQGVSLENHLEEHGPIDTDLAILLCMEICDALNYVHEHGILHRDLKPSNILLVEDQSGETGVRIIDFGIAKTKFETQEPTIVQGRSVVGTPKYMSPDQVNGKIYDGRSEIYSLGCTFFEMLTGTPPFTGESSLEIISMHAHNTPPTLTEVTGAEFSDVLENVVATCLAKSPEDRYQTMEELRTALLDPMSPSVVHPRSKSKKHVPFLVIALGSVALIGALSYPLIDALVSNTDDNSQFSTHSIDGHGWLIAQGKLHAGGLKKLDSYARQHKPDVRLILDDPEISDTDLGYLRDLPLSALDVSGTKISNQGLVKISKFPLLRILILNYDKRITNAGLDHVVHSDVTILGLRSTGVNDEAAPELAKMENLMSLDLSESKSITKKSIVSLQRSRNLVALRVGGTGVRGADLGAFTQLHLRALSLANLDLKDSDMQIIASLPLSELDISNNDDLSDDGLRVLQTMKLSALNVMGCPKVTKTGLSELQKANSQLINLYSDSNPYDASIGNLSLPKKWKYDKAQAYYNPDHIQMWFIDPSRLQIVK